MKTGVPSETGDASETGAALRLVGCAVPVAVAVGPGLARGDGLIVGNRPAALPAPMSKLAWPLRAGMGPSGSTARFGVAAEAFAFAFAFALALADFAGAAAVTAMVMAAAGGVHVAVVTTLAVTVSFTEVTEVTEVAVDATAIWALRLVGWAVVTELTPHTAVPLPEAQPLLNVGFWLDGCAVSATDTSEADPFWVEICTT